MNAVRQSRNSTKSGPSTFALLVDDISKMTESEQKVLWVHINKEKLSSLAKEIDKSVAPHNFSSDEISAMITEARKHGRKKKS